VSLAEEIIAPMSSRVFTCAAVEIPDPEDDGVVLRHTHQQCARLKISEVLSNLTSHVSHLSEQQGCDIMQLFDDFPALFNGIPSHTTVLEPDINVVLM